MKHYKLSPEVRAYKAKQMREYRARKKAREAEACTPTTSLTYKPLVKGVCINECKETNT